jgi:hypothetical protein
MKHLLFLLLICVLLTGCDGTPKPTGLPELYPVKLTIVQEGIPFVGVSVILEPEDAALSRWVAGGLTDAAGVCVVQTYGQFSGAPLGKFKITLSKEEMESGPTSKLPVPQDPKEEKAYYAKVTAEEKYFDCVDAKYKSVTTTDLEIEVVQSGVTKTFDIGKPVRREFKPAGQ